MSSPPADVIEIKTENLQLSAAELIQQRHVVVESPRSGLKRTRNEGTQAENEELANAYENLHAQLSLRRIERHTGRAVAAWQPQHQAAEVLRKDGKFENFGHNKDGKLYLEYYEALFLLELNRLQLEYSGMIVSVEQAYVLLLGQEASDKYNTYLVYSTLTRAGYIVVKHLAALEPLPCTSATIEDCVWAILEETVCNKVVPKHIKASAHYGITQARMIQQKHLIMDQTATQLIELEPLSEFKFDTRKRWADVEPPDQAANKRMRYGQGNSLIDQLRTAKFGETFARFNVVQLQTICCGNEFNRTLRSFKISFDLHLHNDGFKRSAPNSPTFSIIIIPSGVPFPSHNEIIMCQRKNQLQDQDHAVPLLVVSVSVSKQIQAFLYYTS